MRMQSLLVLEDGIVNDSEIFFTQTGLNESLVDFLRFIAQLSLALYLLCHSQGQFDVLEHELTGKATFVIS